MSVEIPAPLVAAVQDLRAVLFLGAGACKGATSPNNDAVPDADSLRDQLSDEFLGGDLKDRSLTQVADLAISETDLGIVQRFVRSLFLPFEPASFHKLLPEIPWHGIATTNYDLIVERSYAQTPSPCQRLIPVLSDETPIESHLKQHANGLLYLKLHGCINQIEDPSIPLILSTEQYVHYGKNRERLFNRLRDWAYELTLVFCGYSIGDAHIQSMLFDLFDRGIRRPRYYVVQPNISDYESRHWQGHSITPISTTLKDFLESLKARLPTHVGPLAPLLATSGATTTLSMHYRIAKATESPELLSYLEDDVVHVRDGMPLAGRTARDFYYGRDNGWAPIEATLDVPRALNDNVLADAVLIDEPERGSTVDLFVIKGPAGSGKSVALKRIAWDAAVTFDRLVLFLRDEGALRQQALQEIADLTGKRIFLFVDSASRHVDELREIAKFCETRRVPMTILTAERDNEWNVRCESLEPLVADEYPLRNLSEKEIDNLLARLERHDALGLLEEKTPLQRQQAFLVRAERQLLVALHEATLGRPFEEIVVDEYNRIIPEKAQLLYLDVCTLNRLGVGVRAGLISRISEIRFEDFSRDFLAPLTHVVRAYRDKYVDDYLYTARHEHVAEIVFNNVLADPESRYAQVIRVLRGLNTSYGSDRSAFQELVRGRSMVEAFPSYELGARVFEVAEEVVGEDPYLLQQRGQFERRHSGGSLGRAKRAIERAHELAPHNKSIRNSLAVLRRSLANEVDSPLERERVRKLARNELESLTRSDSAKPHDYSALADIALDELRDLLPASHREVQTETTDRMLLDAIERVERTISRGLQTFPDHEYLLTAEVRLRDLLKDHDRAAETLRKAFQGNPRNEWMACRLADSLLSADKVDEAKEILVRCLAARPSATLAHLSIAKIYLMHGSVAEREVVRDHLRRSFIDGDLNLEGQYLYARQLFLEGNFSESKRRFSDFARAAIPSGLRNAVRWMVLDEDGSHRVFAGTVSRGDVAYCFVSCDSFRDDIYSHRSAASEEDWSRLHRGVRVFFELGFTFRGPRAVNLRAAEGRT